MTNTELSVDPHLNLPNQRSGLWDLSVFYTMHLDSSWVPLFLVCNSCARPAICQQEVQEEDSLPAAVSNVWTFIVETPPLGGLWYIVFHYKAL